MITVVCICGTTSNVPDHLAGRRGKCRRCQAPIQVPGGTDAAELPAFPEPVEVEELVEPDDGPAPIILGVTTNSPDAPGTTPDAPLRPLWKRRWVLAVVIPAALLFAREWLRSGDLQSKLRACDSAKGQTIGTSCVSPFSDDIVFDVRAVDGSTRKVDLIHLLLQFGRAVDGYSYRTMYLRSAGTDRFSISHPDMKELSREYTVGNPLWSILHLASRLRSPDGSKAHDEWTGGAIGVMRGQAEDMKSVTDELTDGVKVQ